MAHVPGLALLPDGRFAVRIALGAQHWEVRTYRAPTSGGPPGWIFDRYMSDRQMANAGAVWLETRPAGAMEGEPEPVLADLRPSPIFWKSYLESVENVGKAHPEWRAGQTHYNVLHGAYAQLAAAVHGTPCDPFNDDTKLPAFLEFIRPYFRA